jgi:hypothetical protein
MKTLLDRKAWSLVAPFGIQYDQNVLSLADGEAVPEPYPGRGVLRGIAGLIFSRDPSGTSETPGVYHGFGGKLMAIQNLPREFSSLDVVLGDVSLSQSFVSFDKRQVNAAEVGQTDAQEDEKKVTKITETLGFLLIDSQLSTISFDLGVAWQDYDFHAIYEASFADQPFGPDDSFTLSQATAISLFASDRSFLSLPVFFSQKLPMQTDAAKGILGTLNVSPTYSYSFSPRLTSGAFLKFEPSLELREGVSVVTLTGGVGLNTTYFLTPWLLLLPGATFDVISSDDKDSLVLKPVASLLMTALF